MNAITTEYINECVTAEAVQRYNNTIIAFQQLCNVRVHTIFNHTEFVSTTESVISTLNNTLKSCKHIVKRYEGAVEHAAKLWNKLNTEHKWVGVFVDVNDVRDTGGEFWKTMYPFLHMDSAEDVDVHVNEFDINACFDHIDFGPGNVRGNLHKIFCPPKHETHLSVSHNNVLLGKFIVIELPCIHDYDVRFGDYKFRKVKEADFDIHYLEESVSGDMEEYFTKVLGADNWMVWDDVICEDYTPTFKYESQRLYTNYPDLKEGAEGSLAVAGTICFLKFVPA